MTQANSVDMAQNADWNCILQIFEGNVHIYVNKHGLHGRTYV
jgi:hypothetical protein